MAKRKIQNSVEVERDVDGSIIQVGDYPSATINNNIDSEGLGQSLGEALSDSDRRARWEEYHRESYKRESREILEPMFLSGISGLLLGAIWSFVTPWETIVIFPITLLLALTFSVFHITQLGVRQNLTLSMFVSILFSLLLNFTTAENWMSINTFVGTLFLGMAGIFIGLISRIVMLFWKPFGD